MSKFNNYTHERIVADLEFIVNALELNTDYIHMLSDSVLSRLDNEIDLFIESEIKESGLTFSSIHYYNDYAEYLDKDEDNRIFFNDELLKTHKDSIYSELKKRYMHLILEEKARRFDEEHN